jgi:hypothetical protein
MFQVGASKESVEAARTAIATILGAPHTDEETKREALRALNGICGVNGLTIANCGFYGGGA